MKQGGQILEDLKKGMLHEIPDYNVEEVTKVENYTRTGKMKYDMTKIARMYAKWHIDLPLCNRLQLEGVGVTDVRLSGICTYQQCNDYFSARRLGINSGRIFTGVLLR